MDAHREEFCPNCGYECNAINYSSHYNRRYERTEHTWSFNCDNCKCEFTKTITEEKIITEENPEITVKGKQECENCDGIGYEKHGSAYEKKCSKCKGEGRV